MTEASTTPKAARRTFDTLVDWFAGCTDSRVQLIATRTVEQVGDQALQLVLRSYDRPVTTTVVGCLPHRALQHDHRRQRRDATRARTSTPPAEMLAAAVDGLCDLEGAGGCAIDQPQAGVHHAGPGRRGAGAAERDRPPAGLRGRAAVGRHRARARRRTTWRRPGATTRRSAGSSRERSSRHALHPDVRHPRRRAAGRVRADRDGGRAAGQAGGRLRRARCASRSAAAPGATSAPTSTLGPRTDDDDRALTIWHLTTELSDKRSLTYSMAIMRNGTSVGQLSFVEAPDVTHVAGRLRDPRLPRPRPARRAAGAPPDG